jgi:hypothetical protein
MPDPRRRRYGSIMRCLLAVLALTTGCFADSDLVETRACNDTGFDLDTLEYSSFDEGALPDGTCTEYRRAEGDAYDYTFLRFTIGADEFRLQPIDFVGETPLPGGRWSYRFDISDYANRGVTVTAIED